LTVEILSNRPFKLDLHGKVDQLWSTFVLDLHRDFPQLQQEILRVSVSSGARSDREVTPDVGYQYLQSDPI